MCSAVVPNQAHKSSGLREDATVGRKGRRRSTVFSNYVEQMLRQELPSCLSPIPSLLYSALFFLLITVVTIPFGAAMFWQTRENTEVILRYDNFAVGNQSSDTEPQITRRSIVIDPEANFTNTYLITVTEKLESPVYVYYELTDYHQNHKRYVRSLSEQQLGGKKPDAGSMTECDPYRFVPQDASSSEPDADPKVILPCGLVAHSLFNDTFALESSVTEDGTDLGLTMDENGIATEWDRKYLYADERPANFNEDPDRRGGGTITGTLKDDEHFMVWMRVGARPTVRKLYGIIREDVPKGATLNFTITHHYNTYDFDGKKKLVLTTSNWTGGRNEFTGIIYFVTGALSAVACVVILIWDLKVNRTPGDRAQLSWNRNA